MTDQFTGKKFNLPVADFIILSHAILSGAAIIVPIPFVDEWIITLVRRSLVWSLSKHHALNLSAAEINLLAKIDEGGCWQGCLMAFTAPLREIRREIFKVLEVKQSVETATDTYYLGVLLNEIFLNGWYTREKFGIIKGALNHAQKDANKTLVSEVFRASLATSKQNYGLLASWLKMTLQYQISSNRFINWIKQIRFIRKTAAEHPETLFEAPPPNVLELLGQLASNLNENLLGKPQEHLQEMKNRLAIALKS